MGCPAYLELQGRAPGRGCGPARGQVAGRSTIVLGCRAETSRDDASRLGATECVQFQPGNTFSPMPGARVGPLPGVEEIRLVEPHGGPGATPLHDLYSRTVQRGRRAEAKNLLAALVPEIEAVDILTDEGEPVVYVVFKDHAVPAALLGDGIQSLSRQSCELATKPGGVVLLEEPEVHQHPTAVWRPVGPPRRRGTNHREWRESAHPASCGGEARVLAQLGLAEAQHDALPRDPGRDELGGHAPLGPVVLDPDAPVADVDVHDRPVHVVAPLPPRADEQLASPLAVEDDLGADLAVPVRDRGVLAQDAFDGVSPGVEGSIGR
jgi:hypothetical protein